MKDKLSLLTELIKLARVDKECRDSEYEFISTIAQMLGVTKDDLNPLFSQYIEFTPHPLETNRILQLPRMVLLCHVDFDVHPAELDHIREFVLRLLLHPNAIEEVLTEIKNHENGMVPADELIGIFRIHHN